MTEYSIAQLQEQMSRGDMSAANITARYLQRIAEIDQTGPTLGAVVEVNPEALEIAEALDRERARSGPRGPLHGVPVLVKENIDTADRMQTTAGSLALAGHIAAEDATVVARLRSAGAVLLGKTNLSEWANFRGQHSTSGWSSRGGQTRNPYALDRNPCGSSSGSAAAVAADLCAVAVGTETDGSILCPSQTCGIVGIKPTLGLVSRAGIIPIAHSQDTAGPMARTVADAALLLEVLAGPDPRDGITLQREAPLRFDSGTSDLGGARIGVARHLFGFDARVDAIMERCIGVLGELGAEVVDPVEIHHATELDETEMEVLLYEFRADLNAYLVGLESTAAVRSLADVIAFNNQNPDRVMPYFAQELMVRAEAKGPLTEEKYLQALATNHRLARQEGLDATFERHNLDAVIQPSGGPAWLTDTVNGDHISGGCTSPAAVAGYPSLTVPAGFVQGLPVGLTFTGAAWSEPRLIGYALAFEQATLVRRPPQFLPSVRY